LLLDWAFSKSKVHRRHNTCSPLDAMCKSSLPAAKPRLRLRCKTAIVQKAAPSPAGKTRHSPTRRRLAIKQQLVLKARKAFALFLMDNTRVKKGALKIFEKGTHGRHEKSGQAMDRVH